MRLSLIQKALIPIFLFYALIACGEKSNDPLEMIQTDDISLYESNKRVIARSESKNILKLLINIYPGEVII